MEKLTDIELTSVQSQEPQHRMVNSNANSILIQEDDVETPYGNFHVAIQGDRSKMAILTFHDIGLNHITCFQGFFNFPDIQQILRHFCVYHVNAPGQEEGSMHLKPEHDVLGNPESLGNRLTTVVNKFDSSRNDSLFEFVYPSMEHLAEGIQHIVDHYSIKRFIGFGVGAGAYILSEYALEHPENVDSLALINSTVGKAGWIEWGYQKLNSWYLWSGQMTNFTEDYLLWHWFGYKTKYENQDLVHVFREYVKSINPQNLSLFIESYLKRRDLGIVRELDPIKRPHARTIKCRSILLVGDDSPHIDQVTDMNGRMDPQETDFMKIQDCGGMPLEEQPGKVCEAFRLFLQGMGYVPTLRAPKNPAQQTRHSPHRKDVDFSKIQPVC